MAVAAALAAAVTSWWDDGGDHVVHLFEASGASWTPLRVFGGGFGRPGREDGQLRRPYGVRVTADGTGVAVADFGNGRVSLFDCRDGSFVRHLAGGLQHAIDTEECSGGWLVACDGPYSVEFVGSGSGVCRATLGRSGKGLGEFVNPISLAIVPGLGLVVRESFGQRLQVFATPDDVAMATMSPTRVAWMVAVGRGILCRR